MIKVYFTKEEYDLDIEYQCNFCGRRVLVDEWFITAENYIEGSDINICQGCIKQVKDL